MRLIEDPMMVVQYRFPKTKKKRIRNKWAKVNSNYKPSTEIVLIGSYAMVCHPATAVRLRTCPQTNSYRSMFNILDSSL